MADLRTCGLVTTDLEMQKSARGIPYVRFMLREQLGYGEQLRYQFFEVWAWGTDAENLVKEVQKGSRLWVRGDLELVDTANQNGGPTGKRLKLKLRQWDFSRQGSQSGVKQAKGESVSQEPAHREIVVVDGDREPLPE